MLVTVPHVDLVEETHLAAAPASVVAAVRDPAFLAALWPDLALEVVDDRGPLGLRWAVDGAWVGSAEIWLEPFGDGVTAHTYLRVDAAGPAGSRSPATLSARSVTAERHRRARHAKRVWWALKDRLEAGRRPGEPAVPAPASPAGASSAGVKAPAPADPGRAVPRSMPTPASASPSTPTPTPTPMPTSLPTSASTRGR